MTGSQVPGKHFEEMEVGDQFTTVGRSITEADIVNFCGVSGDFNQLHSDIEYASRSTFGQRIAHGMCGLAVASGSFNRSGLVEGTTIAFVAIKEWNFRRPIFINDTVYVKIEVRDKRETGKPDRGLIAFWISVVNQKEQIVMDGQWDLLIARKV